MTVDKLSFPRRRTEVAGKWAPIMFEPILGSGERFTVAVVAVLNGEAHIRTAPALHRFECLYGPASRDVLSAVQITLEDVRDRVAKEGPEAAFSQDLASHNAMLGNYRIGNGSSADEVLDDALHLCSSFAIWKHEPHPAEGDFTEEELEHSAPSASFRAHESQLVKIVSRYVGRRNDRLLRSFSQRFRTSKKGRESKIDFLGRKLIANLRQIHTGRQLAASVDRGKAGLLDLEVYRSQFGQQLFPAAHHTLFLHVPSQSTRPELSNLQTRHVDEAVEELVSIAKKQELEAIPMTSTDAIGDAIIAKELEQQALY